MGVLRSKARYAALKRHHGPDDPVTVDARRDLAAEHLEQVITRIVDAAPPLSEQQRARLVAVLSAGDAA